MRRASSSLYLTARIEKFTGQAGVDQTRQALAAAKAGNDAEVDLGLAEHGLFTGEAEITGHAEFAAAAKGVAVHSRRNGFFDLLKTGECRLAPWRM